MVPTITLPDGLLVDSVARACRRALETFATLDPTSDALADWVVKAYCPSLVGPRKYWPSMLDATDRIEPAQRALESAGRAARDPRGELVEHLPKQVYIARVYDRNCACGFGPIDVLDAPLEARVLSLLLADFLMHPDEFAPRDVYVRHRSGTQLRLATLARRAKKIG